MTRHEGFGPLRSSPFSETIGPLLVSDTRGPVVVGVEIGAHHTNSMGRAHGGLIVTVADVAIGQAAKRSLPTGTRAVTVSMHTTFLRSARVGDWLEAHPDVKEVGQSVALVSCRLQVGERPVAHVAATLALTNRDAGELHRN